MVFLTFLETIITANNTRKAPKLAEIVNKMLDCAKIKKLPPNIDDPKTKIATPKVAPELIPKTYGPANGFLNKVCIKSPPIASPEPTIKAVIAFGNL